MPLFIFKMLNQTIGAPLYVRAENTASSSFLAINIISYHVMTFLLSKFSSANKGTLMVTQQKYIYIGVVSIISLETYHFEMSLEKVLHYIFHYYAYYQGRAYIIK